MIRSVARSIGASPAVLALSVARLGDALGNSILFIVLPLYVARTPAHWFSIPVTVRVGLLISLYGLVNTTVQPAMGALSDRLGRRKLMIQVGLALMAAATLGYIWARHYTDLFVLRVMQGVAVGMTVPAAMGLMAIITVKETRGGAMGVYSTTRMIGFGAGPLIGGFVYERFGFNAAFCTGAAFILLGLLLVQVWVHDVRVDPPPRTEGRFRVFDRQLLHAGIVGAGFATFVMAADFSMLSTLENQFNERLEQTALGFAVAFSALMFSRLLFQIPLGRVSDRVGAARPGREHRPTHRPATGSGRRLGVYRRAGLRAGGRPLAQRRRRPADEHHHDGVRARSGAGTAGRRAARRVLLRAAVSGSGRRHIARRRGHLSLRPGDRVEDAARRLVRRRGPSRGPPTRCRLLRPQRLHRIDERRAPCRQVGRQQRHARQAHGDEGVSDWVERAHPEE
jgi:MFS family permease